MTMRNAVIGLTAVSTLALGATSVLAQDLPFPVQARQGQMKVMALNLGVVGNMARGNTDYDAEAAQAAADNLVAISMVDQRFHWPEGTDNFALDGTRALPAIWEDMAGFAEDYVALGAAAEGLAEVAGDGLDPMRAALGPVGEACSACHDDYRESE